MTFFNDDILEERFAQKIPKIRKKSLMLNIIKPKKSEKADKKRAMLYSKKDTNETEWIDVFLRVLSRLRSV